MSTKSMYRQVFVLATAQALFQIVIVAVMLVGGLIGSIIADSPRWATLPIATMFLGTAIMIFPASLWMAKIGRRAGFLIGAIFGLSGTLIAALGVWQSSLLVLAMGTFLIGTYQAFAQFYRFAAAEAADLHFRSKAISFVLAGGVAAALIGPVLARFEGPLLSTKYLGTFLILAMVTVLAIGTLMAFRPAPATSTHGATAAESSRSWLQMVTQPTYLVAMFAAASGQGIMILGMTAAPIAMSSYGHELSSTALVIQLHVLGMFVPSFFTGALIARFGVLQVMLAGAALLLGHILFALSGVSFISFAIALVLLGVGWNFLFIGGTTLLTTTYSQTERARAQATNDLVIFIIGFISSFSSGALLHATDWQMTNLFLIPWLILTVLAILWLRWKNRPLSAQRV
ncbi:MAG: MFS transporter [Alcaligenaceae bacterium]|nr:MFS transporter [Alcaligenaceae bacterium]